MMFLILRGERPRGNVALLRCGAASMPRCCNGSRADPARGVIVGENFTALAVWIGGIAFTAVVVAVYGWLNRLAPTV